MIPKLALDSIVKTVKPLGSAVFFPTLSGEVWMSLRQLIKYALSLPPRQAAGKGWRLARRLLAACRDQTLGYFRSTYGEPMKDAAEIESRVAEIPARLIKPLSAAIAVLSGHYLDHRFDLLGSGWVKVEHGMHCPGFEGVAYPPGPGAPRVSAGNRRRARMIRRLIDRQYRRIDWQLDFKSGYRWSERRAAGAILYGHAPAADVKVPWELSRLQHLPHLAWAFILAKAGEKGFQAAETYRAEFRNQVLDFLAANPPRFGVNWSCPMDIAIRAANLCLAVDLFRRHGARFDDAFLAEFGAALRAHGRHIAANLEWHVEHRANHYLADVCGLLFVAATLPRRPETDIWLAFAVRQLIGEVERQFTPDGGNFEASTAYHRLSAEMAIYATAFVLGLPAKRTAALAAYDHRLWPHRPPLEPAPVAMHPVPGGGVSPFPAWYFERLERMVEFTIHATKPDGHVVQIGDHDSGRFFKPCPVFNRKDEDGWDEDHLDHRSLAAAAAGLFRRADWQDFAGDRMAAETALVEGLAGGVRIAAAPTDGREIVICLAEDAILAGLKAIAYPDFGLFIWRGRRFFLSLRCGPVGQNGNGGHAHNDQLAMELQIDGEDWLADPGSYVYTPAPKLRNAYRSVLAHAAPRDATREPARLDLGLFRLEDRTRAACVHFDEQRFHGIHFGFGAAVHRVVEIGDARITVRDTFEPGIGAGERLTITSAASLRGAFDLKLAFSPGYGKLRVKKPPNRVFSASAWPRRR
jgi:hypothetical protein